MHVPSFKSTPQDKYSKYNCKYSHGKNVVSNNDHISPHVPTLNQFGDSKVGNIDYSQIIQRLNFMVIATRRKHLPAHPLFLNKELLQAYM